MAIRIAINGYGRIGRNVLRALYENNYREQIEIIAINDLGDANTNAHLTQYDTVHGTFAHAVKVENNKLIVNNDKIVICNERNPGNLPWATLGIDVVLECTGLFTDGEKAQAHIKAGAKKVIISAPASNVDATIVYGVNDHILTNKHNIISNASCTTNCLAPLAKIINDTIGIESGLMTTIHSFTNDQALSDAYHTDLRRARAATHSMIPTKTGAASAVGLVLPEIAGLLDGLAVRVPTINVSLVDLSFIANKETTVNELNNIIKNAALADNKGVIQVNEAPLVSVDFNHNPASCVFDATQTRVTGRMVKVLAWYDNEWGFSNRMLDNTLQLMLRECNIEHNENIAHVA
ncbi:type I glyceraldehyde-3-phosphate dehydrogenase [Gammaproteobacteria bacterium 42_54_T18]|nr:type I glyceraldehyde-3-phosphate dehydrogenase [Gammaproteobacteria bacterium 42_54_T18]